MPMKNRLGDLNNHLFEQLERLNDTGLKGEDLKEEIERSRAVSQIAKDITHNALLVLQAQKVALEYGMDSGQTMPRMLEGK